MDTKRVASKGFWLGVPSLLVLTELVIVLSLIKVKTQSKMKRVNDKY